MKNYFKFVAILAALFVVGTVAFAIWSKYGLKGHLRSDEVTIQLNDLASDAEEHWEDLSVLKDKDYGTNYVILDMSNRVLLEKTGNDTAPAGISVEKAIKAGYPYAYIIKDNCVEGCVILLTDTMEAYGRERMAIIIGLTALCIIFIAGAWLFGTYINRSIIEPFERMKNFAGKVAEGNLDEPLTMDRGNMFGAFTESFDIMREELSESKKREIALQKKERELVASLSHDLKTPITGIKLTVELLQAQTHKNNENTEILGKLDNISKKAEQIDALVSDLFSSTLEDLGEFKVIVRDEPATVITDIIKKYDDRDLVKSDVPPNVLINVDTKRLSQVIGNIISNSYKYAETKIDVTYKILDEFLEMRIRDYGPGVPEDEISLIANKFYRGKKWADSKEEGSGLGLYIAKTLMEKMNGEMLPENTEDGFAITLLIPLS
ncbi:MAG: HAMP domain-containing histidine kinase [Lachnospiraceae bacterium]|nr:HAMP domain-containing histidine kinase [Lachnospiraceae bacterium]